MSPPNNVLSTRKENGVYCSPAPPGWEVGRGSYTGSSKAENRDLRNPPAERKCPVRSGRSRGTRCGERPGCRPRSCDMAESPFLNTPPPHDERGGTGPLPWIQALRPTAQALGNAPRRPAPRAKGLLRCYHRGSGSNHGKNLMANACSDGRRCSPLCRDEGDEQHSAWAWGQGSA